MLEVGISKKWDNLNKRYNVNISITQDRSKYLDIKYTSNDRDYTGCQIRYNEKSESSSINEYCVIVPIIWPIDFSRLSKLIEECKTNEYSLEDRTIDTDKMKRGLKEFLNTYPEDMALYIGAYLYTKFRVNHHNTHVLFDNIGVYDSIETFLYVLCSEVEKRNEDFYILFDYNKKLSCEYEKERFDLRIKRQKECGYPNFIEIPINPDNPYSNSYTGK